MFYCESKARNSHYSKQEAKIIYQFYFCIFFVWNVYCNVIENFR